MSKFIKIVVVGAVLGMLIGCAGSRQGTIVEQSQAVETIQEVSQSEIITWDGGSFEITTENCWEILGKITEMPTRELYVTILQSCLDSNNVLKSSSLRENLEDMIRLTTMTQEDLEEEIETNK